MDPVKDELPAELQRALEALEARASRSAARIVAERVAARVLARLRDAEAGVAPLGWRAGRMRRLVQVAASVAFVALAGVVGVKLAGPRAQPTVTAVRLSLPWPSGARASGALTPSQSDSLYKAVDEVRVLNAPMPLTSASVEELSTQELRALLDSMQVSEEGTL